MIRESETTGLDSAAAPRPKAMTDCSSEDQKYLSMYFVKLVSVVIKHSR